MLKVSIDKHNSAVIMKIEGEVDLYSSPEVREPLLRLIDDKTPIIIVNMENVEYIDSSGIATLVESLQKIGEYAGKLKLLNPNENVRDVFELSNLDKVFEIHDSIEEALQTI
jgi:anti-sigma B factor antagonist